MPSEACSDISLAQVATATWLPALILSLASFVTSSAAILYVVIRTKRNQKYMAAYQADTVFLKVGVAQDEAASLIKDIDNRWAGELDGNRHLQECKITNADGSQTPVFEPSYRYNYALFYLLANNKSEEDMRLNVLRRQVDCFWQGIQTLVDGRQLPDTFLSWRTGVWASRGKNYRMDMQPIDIAEYYRRNRDLVYGHYHVSPDRGTQYQMLEKAMPPSVENTLDDDERSKLIAKLIAARQFQAISGGPLPVLLPPRST